MHHFPLQSGRAIAIFINIYPRTGIEQAIKSIRKRPLQHTARSWQVIAILNYELWQQQYQWWVTKADLYHFTLNSLYSLCLKLDILNFQALYIKCGEIFDSELAKPTFMSSDGIFSNFQLNLKHPDDDINDGKNAASIF